MTREIELLIRKNALKDVEIWLNQQYVEIENELMSLTEDRNDDSAKSEVRLDDEFSDFTDEEDDESKY